MLWVMNSKDMDTFLNNESDDDILEAQYVIVSNRIRRVGTAHANIIQASVLFPNSMVACQIGTDEFRPLYFQQLDDNKTLLALLIRSVIIDKFNIIFLCTKKEEKLGKYLDLLAQYIYNEFDCPVYRYMDVAKGRVDIIDYDESKVYARCMKIIDQAKQKQLMSKITTDKKLSNKNKKVMKKLLKEEGLYSKGMSTQEMRNMIEVLFDKEFGD